MHLILVLRGSNRKIAVACPFFNLIELVSFRFSGGPSLKTHGKEQQKITHDIDLWPLQTHENINEHRQKFNIVVLLRKLLEFLILH